MNADKAKIVQDEALKRTLEDWSLKALRRAEKKICSYAMEGAFECEIDLKFPPSKPNDKTSEKVAKRLKKILADERGFDVRIIQRVNHDGAICRIIWK